MFFRYTVEGFFVTKIFGTRQTRRNFNIILVMTTAGRRAGAAQSYPVSSYLNYKFQNREKVANNVTLHILQLGSYFHPDLERCVYIHLLHYCSCKVYSLGFIPAYVLVKKYPKTNRKNHHTTNFVALPDHILLIDILSF